MPPDFEAIFNAVAAKISSIVAPISFPLVSRRLVTWDKIGAAQSPAAFVHQKSFKQEAPRAGMPPVRWVLEGWIVVYTSVGPVPTAITTTPMNIALGALILAFRPAVASKQNLGLAVIDEARLGDIQIYEGDMDGNAMAVIDLRIILKP